MPEYVSPIIEAEVAHCLQINYYLSYREIVVKFGIFSTFLIGKICVQLSKIYFECIDYGKIACISTCKEHYQLPF